MPDHQNKKPSRPSSGSSSRDDGTKAMMHYSNHPKLNKDDNKIKVMCVHVDVDDITESLPTLGDGDPKEKLLITFYKLKDLHTPTIDTKTRKARRCKVLSENVVQSDAASLARQIQRHQLGKHTWHTDFSLHSHATLCRKDLRTGCIWNATAIPQGHSDAMGTMGGVVSQMAIFH